MIDTKTSYANQIEGSTYREKMDELIRVARENGCAITTEGRVDHERLNRRSVLRRAIDRALRLLGKKP